MHDLALDVDGGTDRHGPQVRDVQGTADAAVLPEAGARDELQRERGAGVEHGRGAAPVQVAQEVGVRGLDGEAERGARMGARRRVGDDGDVL